ncbi:MAG: methyltransferase domain-containing protein [Alphaproteobacteria bacterium]
MTKAAKTTGVVGDGIAAENANWRFAGEVAQKFDDHVRKSVPFYEEGHDLVCQLSDFFVMPGSVVYEIGCSTGVLTTGLARHNRHKPSARFIGLDIEADMIAKAEERRQANPDLNLTFVTDDALQAALEPADFIVCYYTVQFVRPGERQRLIDKIYGALRWGGGLAMFEKVRGPDARFQDMLSRLYDDFKLRQGYTPDEIVAKARSLKGILEPFSTQGNLDLLKRAGFVDIMTVMRYLCFEGFLAIK